MVNGNSILDNLSDLFVSKNGENDKKEIEIIGIKSKTGIVSKKEISCTIDKSSLLYKLLRKYETYFKTDFTGNFLEGVRYQTRPPYAYYEERKYEVRDKDNSVVIPWDTKKYRKVFASGKLFENLSVAKGPRELADLLKESLHHGDLDTTLGHYLMKTNRVNSVLDIAIATITSSKLEDALQFKGKIGDEPTLGSKGKRVYLCDCDDPTSPSHGLIIAEECLHYDMCLGCERSTVYELHLPFICARIMQYEKFKKDMGNEWDSIFGDKWMIAHDALNTFANKKRDGTKAVKEAWLKAENISLPSILMKV